MSLLTTGFNLHMIFMYYIFFSNMDYVLVIENWRHFVSLFRARDSLSGNQQQIKKAYVLSA